MFGFRRDFLLKQYVISQKSIYLHENKSDDIEMGTNDKTYIHLLPELKKTLIHGKSSQEYSFRHKTLTT